MRLQQVFNRVILSFDCAILCGYRGQKEQDEAFAKGLSKLKYPEGKHNHTPSKAVDVMPYPIHWPGEEKDFVLSQADRDRIFLFAGFVLATAKSLGVRLRWGGDWNGNLDLRDESSFRDLPHFELVD